MRLIDSFDFRWKNCTRAEALVQFSHERLNEFTEQQDIFYYKICPNDAARAMNI